MSKKVKVPSHALLDAGIRLMKLNGHSLHKANGERGKIYKTENGETVRVRTTNDHALLVEADRPDLGARLAIEGTDCLLVVMPEKIRTPGKVLAYFIPARKAADDVREAHGAWLQSGAKSQGHNKTWCIWFHEREPKQSSGFANKWKDCRLAAVVSSAATAHG